jgi:AcrR family transcriptional regulator
MSEEVPPETKGEVAEAVRKALAKHGYARLTTKAIAAESEKSEAGLYYYYDSKDEMIAAFLEVAAGSLRADLEEGDFAGPEERLRFACDRLFVDRENERDRGVNVAIMELLSHAPYNETLRGPLTTLEEHTLETLTGIVADGVETGVFREVDPRGTAAFLLAAGDGATGFHLALGIEDVGDRLHEQAHLFVDSLLSEP